MESNYDVLARRDGESAIEHHRRLVYGKLVDKTLADYDYSELASYVYGKDYSADVARRMLYGSCKTLELADQEQVCKIEDRDMLSELDAKMIELQKERQKFFDQRNAFAKAVRDHSRKEEINEILERCLSEGHLPELAYEEMDYAFSDNDILVSLNDIHFGATVNNSWRTYNSDVCAQMMRDYLSKILQIADTHKSENCIVWCAGDSISGSIHRSIQVTNKENVIEQITGVSELIAQFLSELSRHFNTVRFVSVSGNHSRLDPNKDNALASERLDDLVEWYLAARLQNFENIILDNSHKMDCTMSVFDVRGKTYIIVHGDYDGSASKVQALQTMAQKPVYAVLSGHKHHNATDTVQGIKTAMAGSFLGMDDFCVQKRIYGVPEQMVCICDEDGIRCHYDVKL